MKNKDLKSFIFAHSRAIIHLFVWMLVAIGVTSLNWEAWIHYSFWEKFLLVPSFFLFPFVFYVNTYRIIPYFHKKKKAFIYGLCLFFLLFLLELNKPTLLNGLNYLLNTDFNFVRFTNRYINGPVGLGVFSSLAYSFIKYLNDYPKLVDRLKAEKTSMELAFLKSQADPHFLFNTLNTLYAMALEENSQKTADGITKLSTLMRYNFHDAQADFIPLEKEISYIENYIALQRLRVTEKNEIIFENNIAQKDSIAAEIAPMLPIPFIENAFKFGISPTEKSFIRIQTALVEKDFILIVENSIVRNTAAESSGVGLKNVKNRLKLLYPEKHKLTCKEDEKMYHIELKVRLTK